MSELSPPTARHTFGFYRQVLDNYIRTGECSDEASAEPLHRYLLTQMNDPLVKIQVLGSEVCARIFYDTMLCFVEQNLKREKYNLQRSQSELQSMKATLEWSYNKRRDGWQALLQRVGEEYREYGFDKFFYQSEFQEEETADGEKRRGYENDALWERMVDDWGNAFRRKQQEEKQEEITRRKDAMEKRLRNNLKEIPEYLRRNNIENEEFFQTWGVMSGMWNTVDYARIRKIVRLQRDYPILEKVANVMGRMADDCGKEQVSVAGGSTYRLEHSSRSDIEGITVGNDLNALLPIELVHCADDELEELFVHKYLTRRLQTFHCQSAILNPARRLEKKPARRKGPMIVCLDTSGSMSGMPEKIAHSLLCKLLELAERQRRALFLIAFSVSIHPIDVKKNRPALLEFFSHTSTGDTDATRMMTQTLQLLNSSKEYLSADVLWISDFRIPALSAGQAEEMAAQRREGTRFYGLQIGIAEHDWASFFDRIYKIGYEPSRRF